MIQKAPFLELVQIHILKLQDPHNTTHDANSAFQIPQNILLSFFVSTFNCEGNEESVSSQIAPLAVYRFVLWRDVAPSCSPGTPGSRIPFC